MSILWYMWSLAVAFLAIWLLATFDIFTSSEDSKVAVLIIPSIWLVGTLIVHEVRKTRP